MTLEPITIDGKTGLVAYLDPELRMVPKEAATLAKVVFDDGSRAFYVLQPVTDLSTRHDRTSYRSRLREIARRDTRTTYRDRISRVMQLQAEAHPLTPEERSDIAHRAWDTRGRGRKVDDPARIAAIARREELTKRWDVLNQEILDRIDQPDSPEVRAALDEQKRIAKERNHLDIDPGGLVGVGQPGGPRDVVIIGAGPGGLSAAISAGVEGLDTLVIEAQPHAGGQARGSSRVENLPGFPVGISGKEYARRSYEQAQRVGADVMLEVRVVSLTVDEETGLKTLTLSNGETIETRSVIMAGGLEVRRLPETLSGSTNPSIIYQDADRLKSESHGQSVVILGGSNGAAQAALGVAASAKDVTVVSRSPIVKSMSKYQITAIGNHEKIKLLEKDQIAEIITNPTTGRSQTVVLKSKERIDASVIGVFLGGTPDTKWLKGTGVARDTKGKIKVNKQLETDIPGVFAVGDIENTRAARIGTAVGQGLEAIFSVFEYIEEVKADVEKGRPLRKTPESRTERFKRRMAPGYKAVPSRSRG